jgi:hypothetical protein
MQEMPNETGAVTRNLPTGLPSSLRGEVLGLLQIGEQLDSAVVEIGARLGKADLPCRPVQKTRAEPVFQVADAPTDRRLRHAKPFSSAGEALRLNDGDEGAYVFELIGHGFRCSTQCPGIENAATDCISLAPDQPASEGRHVRTDVSLRPSFRTIGPQPDAQPGPGF